MWTRLGYDITDSMFEGVKSPYELHLHAAYKVIFNLPEKWQQLNTYKPNKICLNDLQMLGFLRVNHFCRFY